MKSSSAKCKSLDSEYMALFSLLTKYIELREASNSTLREAYFNLARAHRSAGYRTISPDQYSGKMSAIARVSASDEDGSLRIERATEAKKGGKSVETKDSHGQGELRRRHKRDAAGDKPPESEADSSDDSAGDEGPAETNHTDDPLHWFGMLVPPALREAQRGFATSLDGIVQLAHLIRVITDKKKHIGEIAQGAGAEA